MRILVPVDGGPYTRRTLAFLGAHGEMFDTADQYTLLFIQTPIPLRARAAVGQEAVDSMHAEETTKATRSALAAMKKRGWKVKLATRIGNPGDEIAALATSGKFDLVVMGTHGRGTIGSLLMGSTAQRVLSHCRVPVLLIR